MKLYMPEKPKEVPEMEEKNPENNLGKNSFDDFEMLDYNEEIKKPAADTDNPEYDVIFYTQDRFDETRKAVNDIAADISSNDEFFVWSNTKKFNDMKKAVYALQKTMNAIAKGKNPGEVSTNIEKAKKQLAEAGRLAEDYGKAKVKSIKDKKKEGKEPSLRAMHRLTDAMNMVKLANCEKPIEPSKSNIAERFTLMVNDINQRCEMFRAGEEIKGNKMTLEELQGAAQHITVYLDKHPSIKEAGKISDKSVNTLKNNVNDMKGGKLERQNSFKSNLIDEDENSIDSFVIV